MGTNQSTRLLAVDVSKI